MAKFNVLMVQLPLTHVLAAMQLLAHPALSNALTNKQRRTVKQGRVSPNAAKTMPELGTVSVNNFNDKTKNKGSLHLTGCPFS